MIKLVAALSVFLLCGGVLADEWEWDEMMMNSVSPTPEPTAGPTLPPDEVKNFTFTLNDTINKSQVCLRMSLGIAINITYNNSAGHNITKSVILTSSNAKDDSSFCNATGTYAKLVLVMDLGDDVMEPPVMVFEFNGTNNTKDQHWEWKNVTFLLHTSYLDNYTKIPSEMLVFRTNDQLRQEPNAKVELFRSYICATEQRLIFNASNATNTSILPFVAISKLQAQVFSFENSTTGAFDKARTCLLDTAGKANKIVPIAVGAALAGLVVVVLIAYLIGRLRSRRQSSYEALS